MSKLELFVSFAIGNISSIIAIVKKLPQTEKTRRWIVGLKAASAALTEIINDDENA